MRNTIVVSEDYAYKKSPTTTSFVRTLLCGAPLFSDPKFRRSGELKSTHGNYMPLSSRFQENKRRASIQESSRMENNIHTNQPSFLVKMYQKNDIELDQAQEYYEKLMCQLTMSNSKLMRENQRYQIRFEKLKMLLEDHIAHLDNIYFTLFLNGINAIQFPDGQTVNLAKFQGTKLKLISRANMLPPDVLSTATNDEKLVTSPSHNNNGSSIDISDIKGFSEDMETKPNASTPLNAAISSSEIF